MNITKIIRSKNEGFTLIEILIVIGLIAILATVVLVALNPARQFAQGRNSQRTANVNSILNAIGQKLADDKGVLKDCLTNIPSSAVAVPTSITAATIPAAAKKIIDAGGADLGCLAPTYMPAFPFDPSAAGAFWTSPTSYDTEYYVVKDDSATGSGRVTVFAQNPESALNQTIFISVIR